MICPHAEPDDVEALREKVRAAPGDYIAQRLVDALDAPDRVRRRARARATSTCDRSCSWPTPTTAGAARRDDARRARRGRARRQLVAERRRQGHVGDAVTALPAWAEWNEDGAGSPWTVGIEEEVMLLDPDGWALASRIDDVLPVLSRDVADHAAAETHGSALELFSGPHATARGAARGARAAARRARRATSRRSGCARPSPGTHPFAQWSDVEVSPGARYQSIYDSMRELARREPTFALHVHVAVPGPRGGDPRAARAARPRAAAARARRELAVLAGPRHRPRVGAGARLRDVPARRHPAAVRRLRRVRRGDRRAAALRRLPRADVPVVGRAAAAEARHDRGPDHGRPDARGRQRGARRAGAVRSSGSRRSRATPTRRSPAARRCSTRTASWPPATGCRRSSSIPSAPAAGPRRRSSRSCSPRCGPHAAALGCESELAAVPALAAEPGYHRQRLLAGVAQGDTVGPGLGGLVSALATDFSAGLRGAGRRLAGPARPRRGPRARAGCSRSPGGGTRSTSAGGGPGPARRASARG